MQNMNSIDSEKLYAIFQKHQIFKNDELDSFIHALNDINDSFVKIYNEHINNILNNFEDKDLVVNNMWDIREEFRHIAYNIDDAKLPE